MQKLQSESHEHISKGLARRHAHSKATKGVSRGSLGRKKEEMKEEGQDCVIDSYRNRVKGDESICLSDWWFKVQEITSNFVSWSSEKGTTIVHI